MNIHFVYSNKHSYALSFIWLQIMMSSQIHVLILFQWQEMITFPKNRTFASFWKIRAVNKFLFRVLWRRSSSYINIYSKAKQGPSFVSCYLRFNWMCKCYLYLVNFWLEIFSSISLHRWGILSVQGLWQLLIRWEIAGLYFHTCYTDTKLKINWALGVLYAGCVRVTYWRC